MFQCMPIQRSIISFSALLSSFEGASKWRNGQETFVQMISSCTLDPWDAWEFTFCQYKRKKNKRRTCFSLARNVTYHKLLRSQNHLEMNVIICNAAVSACEKGQQQRSFKDELLSWLPTQSFHATLLHRVLYIFWYWKGWCRVIGDLLPLGRLWNS